VYYVTSNLDPKSLKDFYGSGACPSTTPTLRRPSAAGPAAASGCTARRPASSRAHRKATDGCVVLANPDLERIIRTVEVRSTPVVIAPSLKWVAPQAARRRQPRALPTRWRLARAKVTGDVGKVLSFYTHDMSANGKGVAEWLPQLKAEIGRARGRDLELKDLSYLRWTDSAETMVVTFGEVPVGDRTGPVKRQYWVRQGSQWKIFFEGTI
jgi:L,D-transpeptidase YnhG